MLNVLNKSVANVLEKLQLRASHVEVGHTAHVEGTTVYVEATVEPAWRRGLRDYITRR